MDLLSLNYAVLFASLVVAATPTLLAGLGALVVEKSGALNLGVEGMMIFGAIAGFITGIKTESAFLGFVGGAAGGAVLSLVYAVLTLKLLANQVATGLALMLFGLGLSAMIGEGYGSFQAPPVSALDFGPLADIPYLGVMFFSHDAMVYFGIAMVGAVWYVLNRTRAGLILRAVGEDHDSAHALGYKVVRTRLIAILFGGAMAGLGGAYLSLVRVPMWTDGMTAGAGWIALALVVFASWRPERLLFGAWLFGGISVLQMNLQAAGFNLPVQYLAMAPYLVTILVLVLISARGTRRSTAAPACLGQSFHASH